MAIRPNWEARVTSTTRPSESARADAAEPAAEPSRELMHAEDHTLVAAFLDGRREAFEIIVERHRRQVYQVCYRFVHNHEDASELTQDVFVRAFKGLRNFKGDASLSTWLYRVGVNVCLNKLALKKPDTEPIDAKPRVDGRADSPLGLLLDDERARVIRAAVDRLPPKQRATLVLRVYQELSHQEIADILGSSVGAVKANFFHALGNLRRLLDTL